MTETYHPPGAFFFSVTLLGAGTPLSLVTDLDASFQEISGIQAEFNTEELVEGGENRFAHRLPRNARYSNLVLKRGVVTKASVLAEWVGQTIGARLTLPIVPQNLLVTLLNPDGNPLIAWGFANAWPVRWEVSPLDSMDNKLLTETLEFSYNYFERIVLGSAASAVAKLSQLALQLASR